MKKEIDDYETQFKEDNNFSFTCEAKESMNFEKQLLENNIKFHKRERLHLSFSSFQYYFSEDDFDKADEIYINSHY